MEAIGKLLFDIFLVLADKFYNNPRNRIEQLLDTVGDGSGTIEMVGATPNQFFITPPPGEIYVINRLNVYIEDGMTENFDAAKYGATSSLANGIVVSIQDVNGNLNTLTPHAITKIGHWNLGAGIDMMFTDFPGATNDMSAVRWTFTKGAGAVHLIGDNKEKLIMNVQDNLGAGGAALVSHIAQVEGFKFRPPKWWGQTFPKAI